jgi:phage/plasmid-associated DNA primase
MPKTKNINKKMTSAEKRNAFNSFMDKHKLPKGSKAKNITHTLFGGNYGSYSIPDKEMDNFMSLYSKVLGIDLHVVERPREVGPLLVDIDFNFGDDDGERQYTNEDLQYIVTKYNKSLKKYYNLKKKNLKAFIFEKGNPTRKKSKNDGSITHKDGFHVVYPYLPMTSAMRFLVRHDVLKDIEGESGFDNLDFTNSLDDVIDKSIIEQNGWMMYGSKKENGQHYMLTKIFKYDGTTENIKKYKHKDLPRLLSNRQFADEAQSIPLKNGINTKKLEKTLEKVLLEDSSKYRKQLKLKKLSKQKNVTIIDDSDDEFDDEDSDEGGKIQKKNYTTQNDYELAKELVNILSKKRAVGYHDWISVCWALKTISHKLLKTWKIFSKKCPGKFDPVECENTWNDAREDGYTIRALHKWARDDNPVAYCDVIRRGTKDLILQAQNGTHNDVARVIFEMYKSQYVCSSITKQIWYEFQGHKWVEVEAGHSLMDKMSDDLAKEFARVNSSLYNQAAAAERSGRDMLTRKAEEIQKVINKLKNYNFKQNVLKECASFFYDKKFEELLDSNKDLIGFENGVYDLKEMRYRPGVPEDYVTMSVGYNYKEYDMDHPYIDKIEKFFSSVMRNDDMKDYLLTLMASFLDGHTKMQKVLIWTGSGCHAKGSKIMMANGSIKKVEDIKVGEKLMGDDSKPRHVKQLFRGKEQMYKVVPKRGDSYTVNENHRLSLKYIGYNCIRWQQKINTWIVIWCERDINRHVIMKSKNFIATNITKETGYENAKKFSLENESNNDNYMKRGDILVIKVKDHLKLESNVKQLFMGYKCGVDYEERKLKIDPYAIGFWLGDGHSYNTAFACDDQPIVDYLEKYSHQEYNVTNNEDGRGIECSNHYLNELKKYNLLETKHIPDDFKFNSRENRLKMLAGIIDSNGHYQKKNKQYEIIQKSEKLLDDIVHLARSLGFAAYKKECIQVCTNAHGGPKAGKYFKTHIFGTGLHEIPCILKRKQASNDKCDRDHLTTSIRLQKMNVGNYYGFEVDKNNRYLLEDFTATMNSNGKSVVVNFFGSTIGEYFCVLPNTVLTRKQAGPSNASPELANARGKRFVTFQEPESDDKIYVGRMKEISGSDWIYARPLFKDPIRYQPQFKLVLTCNKLPDIPSTDDGTWRRLRVAPWESQFVDLDKKGLFYGKKLKSHQAAKDYDIMDKLEKWKKVFIWYLIHKYYKKFTDEGLEEPSKVMEFTNKWKKDSDVYLEYLDENLVNTGNNRDVEHVDVIYTAFRAWYKESYSNGKCPDKKELKEYMTKHDYKITRGFVRGYQFATENDAPEDLSLNEQLNN